MLHDTHSSTIYFLFVTFNTQAIESIIVIDVITISTTTAVIINLVPSELESRSRQGESKILFFHLHHMEAAPGPKAGKQYKMPASCCS